MIYLGLLWINVCPEQTHKGEHVEGMVITICTQPLFYRDSNIVWSFGEDIFRLVALAPKSGKKIHSQTNGQTNPDRPFRCFDCMGVKYDSLTSCESESH